MKKIIIFLAIIFMSSLSSIAQNIDANADNYTQVKAFHILTKTKNQAKSIITRVNNGESFRELARKFSYCPSSQVGGNLGWFGRGEMVPEFEKAAFETPKGEISDPVKTEFGWHVIKVVDKK